MPATDGTAWAAFPRRYARTRRFTLGEPRSFTVSPDGSRTVFLRANSAVDPRHRLWLLDVGSGTERCLVDPASLDVDETVLPAEERARRERVRESAAGIVAYAADADAHTIAFPLGGRLFLSRLDRVHAFTAPGPVVDPRPDPTGTRTAFVADQGIHLLEHDSGRLVPLLAEDDADVSWGLAEFVAAEEMGRTRGFWWSPQGDLLAVARVDVGPVRRWYVSDAADPAAAPTVLHYPAAGTPNAAVDLAVVDLGGRVAMVEWDQVALPYLVDVVWGQHGPLTLRVQSRDQRRLETLAVRVPGELRGPLRAEPVAVATDPHWVELVAGVPRWLPDGQFVDTTDRGDTRRLTVGAEPVTPPGLQVRRVVGADRDGVLFTATQSDPTATSVWRLSPAGALERLTSEDGTHEAAGRVATPVLISRFLDRAGAWARAVTPAGAEVPIASHADTPPLPRARLVRLGERALASALVLPTWWEPEGPPLPVLLDPYGGPHAQRVVQAASAFGVSQWFAEAGFAVLVTDGRGTPGRGPAWEKAIAGDLATAPLDDQVDALHEAAERYEFLDLDRVGIRGWSFGGYLAALALLRRPDVFGAAIAGAPVTDWRLYDTHYTERYLGDPAREPLAYARSSLLDDAARLSRPLLLIHGLSDDNVVVAHTLRLSRALLEAGRPHRVLPLSGVTHMTPQEVVAENLLQLQLAFLCEALGVQPRQDGAVACDT